MKLMREPAVKARFRISDGKVQLIETEESLELWGKLFESYDTKEETEQALNTVTWLSEDEGIWSFDGTYHLRNGEYARPTYTPKEYKDGWGIEAKHYFYEGTYTNCSDGRINVTELLEE